MKKLLTAIAMGGFLISPCAVSAAYIIHFKDGRDFVTEQYSEEGDLIKFEQYGGRIGIQKGLVSKIEEIADLPKEKETPAVKPEAPGIGLETGYQAKTGEGTAKAEGPKEEGADREKKAEGREQKTPVAISEEEKKKAEQEKTTEVEMILDEKRQIMERIETVAAGLKDAQGKNNKAEKRKWLMERTKLLNTLSELENSVKSAHGGKLPDWWRKDQ